MSEPSCIGSGDRSLLHPYRSEALHGDSDDSNWAREDGSHWAVPIKVYRRLSAFVDGRRTKG